MNDRPLPVFLAHSMGAHLAMALTHRLRSEGVPLPCHLFLSARRAPASSSPMRPLMAEMSDVDLSATVERRFGDASLITDEGLSRLMLPTLRADIAATENWQTVPEPRLAVAIAAMGGMTISGWLRPDWRLGRPIRLDRFSCGCFRVAISS
jgi:medium-chain acyl-[acyl-carrier-protein] hydrolase